MLEGKWVKSLMKILTAFCRCIAKHTNKSDDGKRFLLYSQSVPFQQSSPIRQHGFKFFLHHLTSNPKEMAWRYEFKLWTTVVCGLFSVCENLLRYYNSSLLSSCENLMRFCMESTCVKAKPTPEQWYHQHQKGYKANSFVMFKVWGKEILDT